MKLTLNIVVGIILLFVAIGLLLKWGIFKKKGVVRTEKEEREYKEAVKKAPEIINNSDLFNPKTWQEAAPSRRLYDNVARQLAKDINNSFHWYNDNEEKIYGVFRSLTDKIQVSQIAFFYMSLFNEDLATNLTSRLSNSENKIILDLIDGI